MNTKLRKTLIAGAVAALVSGPTFAAGEARGEAVSDTETRQMSPQGTTAGQKGTTGARTDMDTSGARAETRAASSSALHAMTPSELEGKDVVDASGEEIGSVDKIVLESSSNKIFAVVSVGGVMGVGGNDVAVSLDDLSAGADEDTLRISSTKEQLEQRGDGDYDKERYVELDNDIPISEFSAFESKGASGADRPAAGRSGASAGTSSPAATQ